MKRKVSKNEEKVLKEILRKCKWHQKIFIKLNKRLVLKIYRYGKRKTTNSENINLIKIVYK